MPTTHDESFEALAVPQLGAVYRVARRLARDEHEAEDLVQETFLKAQKAFGRFEMREFGIRPWLLKILHNAFLNRRASEKRMPRSAAEDVLEQTEDPRLDADVIGPPELDYERVDEEVKSAIDALRPEFKSVLLMWATMDLSYQQIADVLNIPIGTVMSRLHRARHQLTTELHEFARQNRLAAPAPTP